MSGKRKECYRPWCGVEKLCVECAQSNSSLAAPTLLGRDFMTLKRFIELELAKIEPQWTAEGKGGYWWGVKIGLETALAKLCEMKAKRPNGGNQTPT